MAVTGFKVVSGRTSGFSRRNRRYEYLYHVYVDDVSTDDIDDIYLAGTLDGKTFPKVGDQHPRDSTAYCTDVKIKEPRNTRGEPSDRLRREVMVTYTTIDPESIQQQAQQGQTPEQRRPERSRTSVDITVPIRFQIVEDRDGNLKKVPLVNSAGIPFSPPPTRVIKSPVFTFTAWRRTFSDDYAALYEGKLNSRQMGRWLRGQIRCNRIQAKDQWEPGWGRVYEVTYEFQANPQGWETIIMDTGLVSWVYTGDESDADYANNPYKPWKWPRDADGNEQKVLKRIDFGAGPISTPAYLKNGVVIDPDDLRRKDTNGDGKFESVEPDEINLGIDEFVDFYTITELDFSA